MISNDTPYTPALKTIKQSKLNCKNNKHRGSSSHYRTPQLNNGAENQTEKNPIFLGGFFDVRHLDEMVNYEMLLLSYIWQEICSMFVFGTMIRGILNYHVAVINNINSYTKSTELTPCVGILKKTYSIKKT